MTIIAYVPVLHEGYRRFFEKYKNSKLLLLGDEIKSKFVPLVKDIRALPVDLIKKSIESWGIFSQIEIVGIEDLKNITDQEILMPDEDIMRELYAEYFSHLKNVKFDSVFLRWDKHKSMEKKAVEIDQKISVDEFDKKVIRDLRKEAQRSADFWRGVAAAIIKDGKVISQKNNRHVPAEQTPYVNGDPRSDFHKGVNLEISSAIHGEAALIAEAAQKGVSLEGASMYVTTFPCPPCAKLIAYSGIKKIYYSDGYAVLDGEGVLKSKGVEIVFVEDDSVIDTGSTVEYKTGRK
jgi:dCMP deaminase